ncbi:MAG: tyrosine--tRNA ligase [Candidatus Nomurabacteria bacterium]|jgi:tyrosyl-tRNA synthetase|nr:tyrosine--tRNA ligase [Candidatus Nomurabacteria bacterium]
MKLSEELIYRGMMAQHTLGDVANLDKKKHKFYFGADPSDSSMTIGNLAALMMCKVFIRHGYEPTLLVGGGTGRIGDPKMDKARPVKSLAEIEQNVQGIKSQFTRIMGADIRVVNNNDWLDKLGFYEFQNEVGQYFSMTQLMDRDFVKARTGEGGTGLSAAEFSYSLLQGYDFWYLYKKFGIDLQLCGVDQIGNVMSGIHLISKKEGKQAHVWSCPLILDTSGKKFGKSEGNAIWLDAGRTSVFDFYQFWLNVDDAGVENYLKIYTEITPAEIDEIVKLHDKNPAARGAQKALALGVAEVVHGREAAVNAAHITNVLFNSGDIRELSREGLKLLSETIPAVKVGATVVEALVSAKLANSNGEALRLIRGGGVSVNGAKIGEDYKISELSLVKKGKNSFVLVK